jgi:hypothetical protein
MAALRLVEACRGTILVALRDRLSGGAEIQCHHVTEGGGCRFYGCLPPYPGARCHSIPVNAARWTTGRLLPPPGEACPPRSAATRGRLWCGGGRASGQPCLPCPYGCARPGDRGGVGPHAVEPRVGQRRIPQGLMPVLTRSLLGAPCGPASLTLFDERRHIAPRAG